MIRSLASRNLGIKYFIEKNLYYRDTPNIIYFG